MRSTESSATGGAPGEIQAGFEVLDEGDDVALGVAQRVPPARAAPAVPHSSRWPSAARFPQFVLLSIHSPICSRFAKYQSGGHFASPSSAGLPATSASSAHTRSGRRGTSGSFNSASSSSILLPYSRRVMKLATITVRALQLGRIGIRAALYDGMVRSRPNRAACHNIDRPDCHTTDRTSSACCPSYSSALSPVCRDRYRQRIRRAAYRI